jgi:hypothetical protein
MEGGGNYPVRPPSIEARGKPVVLSRHAENAMVSERPPIRVRHLARTLEAPDHDDGKTAWKRIANRTVLVHYQEEADQILVKTVSATRGRLRP